MTLQKLKIGGTAHLSVVREKDAERAGDGLSWVEVPDVLDIAARAEWERLSVVFANRPTRFREGDRAAVAAYCAYWSLFHASAADVAERGPVVEGRSDKDRERLVKNPAMVALREASTQLRYWARELGLTPDTRTRMGVVDVIEDGEVNPFAAPDVS